MLGPKSWETKGEFDAEIHRRSVRGESRLRRCGVRGEARRSGPQPPEAGRPATDREHRANVAQGGLEEEPRPDDVDLGPERDDDDRRQDLYGKGGDPGPVRKGR